MHSAKLFSNTGKDNGKKDHTLRFQEHYIGSGSVFTQKLAAAKTLKKIFCFVLYNWTVSRNTTQQFI